MFAVPAEECWVRMVVWVIGHTSPAARKKNFPNAIHIVDMIGQQNSAIIRDRQQPAVEHPMHRSR
jgi:hypothetical protein